MSTNGRRPPGVMTGAASSGAHPSGAERIRARESAGPITASIPVGKTDLAERARAVTP
ncbi:hypothetical protein AADR41_28475 [Streptomyces sp. CLV115]|uniref:hypothetical protein n=1 Tax=Streptomyces sp. CLV115 TaxID=3138502 RepID=UPI00313EB501